jgi:hypothetical protein
MTALHQAFVQHEIAQFRRSPGCLTSVAIRRILGAGGQIYEQIQIRRI